SNVPLTKDLFFNFMTSILSNVPLTKDLFFNFMTSILSNVPLTNIAYLENNFNKPHLSFV
ncbi:MAG: hypothetical protein PHI86_07910, partial [Candidatus Omnitrophica bacterium]|nr:hypothetical protein [Candidatus Omnitrophota bacterium]